MLSYWWIGFLLSIIWGIIVGFWIYARFLSKLRDQHPSQYLMLGSPTLLNRSIRKGIALQKFIYSSQINSLNDHELLKDCWFIRWFNIILIGTVFICFIFGLVNTFNVVKG